MHAASVDARSPPDAPSAPRALPAEALARCEALEAQNDRLRQLLLKFKRQPFGRKPERLSG